jgi:hypothetical protein
MRKQLTHLPEPVARTIIAFYLRKQFYGLLRSLLAPLLCYAVLALLAMHVDRFLFLEQTARLWISGLTHGITLLVGVVSVGFFLWRRLTVSGVAYELERMLPKETAERLVTLHDVLGGRKSAQGKDSAARAALVEQLIHETVTLCERTPNAGRLARDRHLGYRTVVAILLGLLWVGLFALPGYQSLLMLKRLTFPMRNLPKPSFVRLTLTPEAPMVGRGGEVVLQVKVEGEIPALLQRPLRWLGADPGVCLLASATGRVDRLAMAEARPMSRPQRRRFVATLGDLQESFSYRVRCGDAQTDIRFAQVVAQPRVTGGKIRVVPPAYTGLEPQVLTTFVEPVPVFAGSAVEVSFSSDQPLESASLVGAQDQKLITTLEPDAKTGVYTHSFDMANPVEMEIVLTNKVGFKNVDRVVVSFVIREDQAPSVRLEYPAGEISAVQGELVPMNMELTDDLGLLEGAIGYQVNAERNAGAAVHEIPLPVEPKKLSQTLPAFLDLEKAGTVPGDEVMLWVRVRDTANRDERSHTVRIQVTAFAGSENERRRLAALEIVARGLTMVELSGRDPVNLTINPTAYEDELMKEAKTKGIALDSRPVAESFLDLLEREQHFTDSAAAADEVRMLQAVLAAQLRPTPSQPSRTGQVRKDAARQLSADVIPGLLNERKARDLIRRVYSLRAETMAAVVPPRTGEAPNQAAFARRIDLLAEALDNTGADVGALARRSSLVTNDILTINRQVSRANRELKQSQGERQQAIASNLCEQIDGWIEALLPPLPEWHAQRLAARAALQAQYEAYCKPREATQVALPADMRMVERSPFLGLGDRLTVLSPGKVVTNAATASEADVLRRMAVEGEFAEWMASPRVTPSERRLAGAFRMLDLATNQAQRAAAGDALRTMYAPSSAAGATASATPLVVPAGFHTQLPRMADAVVAGAEPYDKAFEKLAAQAARLRDLLTPPAPAAGAEGAPDMTAVLAEAGPGLVRWEADAMALACRLHLDLTYGDPTREQTGGIAAVLPALRHVIERYQGMVPALMVRIRQRTSRSPSAVAAAALDAEELARAVGAMESGMKRVMKQWRGELPAVKESAVAREIRGYYIAARKMAAASDPAAVAEAFFKEQPAAAAMVLEHRLRQLPELQRQFKAARETLTAGADGGDAFLATMRQSERIAGDIVGAAERFAALDAGGSVRALATKTHESIKTMIAREITAETLPRLKLDMDDLRQRMEELKSRSDEVLARYAAPVSSGWRGGPAGIWDDASRRDAETARRRIMAQFDRARRDTVLGFDAVLAQRGKVGAASLEAPLASSLFAWCLLHSTLGGNTTTTIATVGGGALPREQLVRWLLSEIDETLKYLRREDTVRPYTEPTKRWTDSAKGILRR